MNAPSVVWHRREERASNLGGGLFLSPEGELCVWVEDDHYNGVVARADLPALLDLVRAALEAKP